MHNVRIFSRILNTSQKCWKSLDIGQNARQNVEERKLCNFYWEIFKVLFDYYLMSISSDFFWFGLRCPFAISRSAFSPKHSRNISAYSRVARRNSASLCVCEGDFISSHRIGSAVTSTCFGLFRYNDRIISENRCNLSSTIEKKWKDFWFDWEFPEKWLAVRKIAIIKMMYKKNPGLEWKFL